MASKKLEIGDKVVTKESPGLLGTGEVIPTPPYSHERLTWAKFSGGTEAAFEPGELETVHDYIKRHRREDRWRYSNRMEGAR